jgi:hypothetical protein
MSEQEMEAIIKKFKKEAKSILMYDPCDLSSSEFRNLQGSARDLIEKIERSAVDFNDRLPEELGQIIIDLDSIL